MPKLKIFVIDKYSSEEGRCGEVKGKMELVFEEGQSVRIFSDDAPAKVFVAGGSSRDSFKVFDVEEGG